MENVNPNHTRPDIRLAGSLTGINPFFPNNSASRLMMDASHIAQAVVLEKPDRMNISSGMDFEYGKYLFDARINGEPDQHVKILKILKKYNRVGGNKSVEYNPCTYVLYENIDTGVIDITEVPTYHISHTTFGFKYRPTEVFYRLKKGDIIECGTVLATSPSMDNSQGQHAFGAEVRCAVGSFREVIEDGIGISESLADRLSCRMYGSRSINYGKDGYLINLYGDENNFKPFPDIGEHIRDDGLLFAYRKTDQNTVASLMTVGALKTFDPIFDDLTYGEPNAKVVDIIINHSHDSSQCHLPLGMDVQPKRYHENHRYFYNELEKFYREVKSTKGQRLVLSPHLHQLIVTGMKTSEERIKKGNKQTYRLNEIEEYRVTIIYEKLEPVRIGHKLSDLSGKVVVLW